jgi:hypothetical protein
MSASDRTLSETPWICRNASTMEAALRRRGNRDRRAGDIGGLREKGGYALRQARFLVEDVGQHVFEDGGATSSWIRPRPARGGAIGAVLRRQFSPNNPATLIWARTAWAKAGFSNELQRGK